MRIAEISTGRIVVLTDDYGAASAIGASLERIELPWARAGGALRRAGRARPVAVRSGPGR